MKVLFTCSLLCLAVSDLLATTVTSIAPEYRHGQIFVVWSNISSTKSGFYYVYTNSVPITRSNLKSSTYIGRVLYNFGYDFRYTRSRIDLAPQYLVINDTPFEKLTPAQNVFVMTCTTNNTMNYFAVCYSPGDGTIDSTITPGSNATTAGITQHLDPVKAYLQAANVPFPKAKNGETIDVYVHYGGNTAAGNYPVMSNEGCLAFHFGITKSGPIGGNNGVFLKFHGGNGNFISNQINQVNANTWKISFDDWIPSFNLDTSGDNTRWVGYDDQLDIYNMTSSTPPPKTGTVRGYTNHRVLWELGWIIKTWPGTLDTTRMNLIGSSEGCAAVLSNCMLQPTRWAAGTVSDPKFNMRAPNDENPDCKYNDTSSGRKNASLLWGNKDSTNLPTDLLKYGKTNKYWNIYELADMNTTYTYLKNYYLPIVEGISGKNDVNTCWDEKIDFYDTVNVTDLGGLFYFDLRTHGGSANNEWTELPIGGLLRYASTISYPAFSNCGLNGNPGSDTVSIPPYYNGDSVGAIGASINWVDASIVDQQKTWGMSLFSIQDTLQDGTYYPPVLNSSYKSDVTIRRAQQFKNIPRNTKLCWTNVHKGKTVQSGSVQVNYSGSMMKPVTIKKVKIYSDTSTLTVTYCSPLRETIDPNAGNSVSTHALIYPNPFGDHINLSFYHSSNGSIRATLFDVLGNSLQEINLPNAQEGMQNISFSTQNLPSGIYMVQLNADNRFQTFKIVKK